MSSQKKSSSVFTEVNENSAQQPQNVIFDSAVFAVDFAKATRKFWYIALCLALIFGFTAGALKHKTYKPMYESSVSFSVTAVSYSANGNAVFASYYDNNSAAQLSKTFPYILNTAMMKNALKNELKSSYINGSISASSVAADSNIFKVTVTSNSPDDAYRIVNAVINVYPEVAVFVVGNTSLKILIQPTLPTEPFTTNNFIRTGIIMALVGIVVGLGLIALYAFFRNTIRKKEDFKNKLNQKCFVEIPYVTFYRTSKKEKKSEHVVRINDRHPTFKESFRLLRKRLLRNISSDDKVIAISAAVHGEGKTMVALNLAHTLALSKHKTACVDFDLKTRSMQKYLKLDKNKGFTDILSDSEPDFSSVCYNSDECFDVYVSGDSSYEFKEAECTAFFEFLRKNYDYIIVNVAPAKEISEAVSVTNMCDSILLVAYQDRTSIDKIRKTLEVMSFSTAKILGFVFNGVQEGFSGYGGYYEGKYGYGRYGYGKYGYGGRYGYGKSKYGYGYGHHKSKRSGGYGYGYGYGYGHGYGYGEEDADETTVDNSKKLDFTGNHNLNSLDDFDIPDNS